MSDMAALLKGDGSSQFTWMEILFLPLMVFSYVAGYVVSVVVVVQKLVYEQPPATERYLYPVLLVVAHLTAGIINLKFHWREVKQGSARPRWLLFVILLPLSPLIRYYRAVKMGLGERKDPEKGIRFLDECVRAGLLRLCDSLCCDVPFLVMLLRDDVWTSPQDWMRLGDGGLTLPPPPPNMRWKIFRLLFLLSKVAQTLAFCSVMLKRQQHVLQPTRYRHLASPAARQGRLNIFATLLVFASHLAFTASRVLGYSLAAAEWGAWVLTVVAARWLAHVAWHALSTHKSSSARQRPGVSCLVGAVWLLGLTNPNGEHQLGRFVLFASFAVIESLTCGALWTFSATALDSPFHQKALLLLSVTLILWLLFHTIHYSFCHPSEPRPSRKAFTCCEMQAEDGQPEGAPGQERDRTLDTSGSGDQLANQVVYNESIDCIIVT